MGFSIIQSLPMRCHVLCRSWLIFPLPNLSLRRWWHRWYKAMYLIPLTWPFKNQVKNCWRQITNRTNHSTPCASSYRRKAWSYQSFCYPCHWKLILLHLLLEVNSYIHISNPLVAPVTTINHIPLQTLRSYLFTVYVGSFPYSNNLWKIEQALNW